MAQKVNIVLVDDIDGSDADGDGELRPRRRRLRDRPDREARRRACARRSRLHRPRPPGRWPTPRGRAGTSAPSSSRRPGPTPPTSAPGPGRTAWTSPSVVGVAPRCARRTRRPLSARPDPDLSKVQAREGAAPPGSAPTRGSLGRRSALVRRALAGEHVGWVRGLTTGAPGTQSPRGSGQAVSLCVREQQGTVSPDTSAWTHQRTPVRPAAAAEAEGAMHMFERFTDRARRVVVLAQEEARMLTTTTSAPSTSCSG